MTEAYCRTGEMLTTLIGFPAASASATATRSDMPFAEAQFDVVWTQHSSMNVENKERLYAEIRRVLRPGGRLALHEIMSGPVQPVHFPVPWARDPAISFLRPPAEIRALLTGTGLPRSPGSTSRPRRSPRFARGQFHRPTRPRHRSVSTCYSDRSCGT